MPDNLYANSANFARLKRPCSVGERPLEAPTELTAAETLLASLRAIHGNIRGRELFQQILAEARESAP